MSAELRWTGAGTRVCFKYHNGFGGIKPIRRRAYGLRGAIIRGIGRAFQAAGLRWFNRCPYF